MLDKADFQVFKWFERLAEDFEGALQELQDDSKKVSKEKIRTWEKSVSYAQTFLNALLRRTESCEKGDFVGYCKATYELTGDLNQTLAFIPWVRWGGAASDRIELQILTVMVALLSPVAARSSIEEYIAEGTSLEKGVTELLREAEEEGLVFPTGDLYQLGPLAPKPFLSK